MHVNYARRGTGEPLLLIHGTGSRWQIWLPVMDRLARERDVIAVDLPGHGRSSPADADAVLDPPAFARILAGFLDELGIQRAHIGGNSAGGWTALEMARLGRALSVTALSPAGLWRGHAPLYDEALLGTFRLTARSIAPVAHLTLLNPMSRTLVLGGMFGKPWRVPYDEAVEFVRSFADVAGYWSHLYATDRARFTGGRTIDVPVTAAWGELDLVLLPGRARYRGELPAHTRWLELPGCGHIPTYDDPGLVASVLLEGSGGRPALSRMGATKRRGGTWHGATGRVRLD